MFYNTNNMGISGSKNKNTPLVPGTTTTVVPGTTPPVLGTPAQAGGSKSKYVKTDRREMCKDGSICNIYTNGKFEYIRKKNKKTKVFEFKNYKLFKPTR